MKTVFELAEQRALQSAAFDTFPPPLLACESQEMETGFQSTAGVRCLP